VYPRKFKRPADTRANVADATQPPRLEGPLLNIQWAVLDVNRTPLCLPGSDKVPAEVSLLQLFKSFILTRYRILWGHYYRSGDIIESGKATSLEEADRVEILFDNGSRPPQTHVDVDYVIGTERFKIRVKKGTTVEQFQESLTYMYKNRQMVGIASEDVQTSAEYSLEDWLQRTKGIPFQVMTAKTVQVVIDFRGSQTHFAVIETVSEEDFKKAVRLIQISFPAESEMNKHLPRPAPKGSVSN
jgi:hypothetical protein